MPVVMHRRPQFTLLHLENLPIELRLQLLAPSHLYYLSLNLVLKVSRYLQLLKSSSLRSPPAADMPRRADNPHPRYASNTPEALEYLPAHQPWVNLRRAPLEGTPLLSELLEPVVEEEIAP